MKAFFSLKSTLRLLSVALLSLTVSACGFHLRGTYMLPDEIAKLSLTSFDQYGQLTRLVKSQFKLHGIEAVPPSATVPNLHLISESNGERTLSLYQNSRAAEYELNYSVRYSITIPNKASKTFSTKVTRTFLDNPLTALAKSVERDMIKDEMREQASRQILRQMARLTATIEALDEQELEAKLAEMEDTKAEDMPVSGTSTSYNSTNTVNTEEVSTVEPGTEVGTSQP
ncbi:LPS assembly lipoprotein LptE [Photobacterium swingsii]|uniref:LPS-assembly lipoprotein LptE n=1 Tax=Photobacterium swingsii TaxID=680026 RepID=UPI00354EE889